MRVKGGPFIPYYLGLNNNPSCQTLSKALDMSRKTPLVSNDGSRQNYSKFRELLPAVVIYKNHLYENLIEIFIECC